MQKLKTKKKSVFLIAKLLESGREDVGISTTFKSAYKLGVFHGGISKPNFDYREALAQLNKDGITIIHDTELQRLVAISQVPILKT